MQSDLPLAAAAMKERDLPVERVETRDPQRPPRSCAVFWAVNPTPHEVAIAEHLTGLASDKVHHQFKGSEARPHVD